MFTATQAQRRSGAPLFLMGQHGVVIVGLQVAVGQSKGGEIMLAVSAPSIGNMLGQAMTMITSVGKRYVNVRASKA